MHELALADAVVTAALQAAEREGLDRITAIRVAVGELQQIRKDTFEFALTEVMPANEPRLGGVQASVEIVPARLACRGCERRFGLHETPGLGDEASSEAVHFIPELAHAYLTCPSCGSPDFEIEEGRGVTIRAIEGEKDD